MNNFLYKILSTTIASLILVCLISCGENDDDYNNGSDVRGWYILDAAKASDFDVINEAIRSKEVLSSYRHATYVATKELFLENGWYSDSNAKFGRLRFTIQNIANAINIIDKNTLAFYSASLWPEGECAESGHELVYRLYAGPIFGDMAYYGRPTYYTYQKNGNKIFVSDGDIYTITSSGLIKDGGTTMWKKYNHDKQY